jgi:hypothetical protein
MPSHRLHARGIGGFDLGPLIDQQTGQQQARAA